MPETNTYSAEAIRLLNRQLKEWPLANKNFLLLKSIRLKTFEMDGFTIKVQFTPSRMLSSNAKVDMFSLKERKCFLCSHHLPPEQEKRVWKAKYLLLVNPYPIFPEHFTIPSIEHVDQRILHRFEDFLELAHALDAFTVFYNGPKSGASAPDHAHFQAVTRHIMPIDDEVYTRIEEGQRLIQLPGGTLYQLTHYLRNGFVIKAQTIEAAHTLFKLVYKHLVVKPDEVEPGMNMFAHYQNGTWTITIIPRKKHRPWQFAAKGEERLLSSPGAADIGGLFVTAREEDFEKIRKDLLEDIYSQVCFNDTEIAEIAKKITANAPKGH
ncbi:hypothetical protein M2101_001264 [Parabacteroides sp. PM5-20]|nr:DUF4922 domain-containing protein [Parabacteroides sp. PM5-20]MDH6534591.1 hypothetical protein [Parabacteroides sp. PM5-20]